MIDPRLDHDALIRYLIDRLPCAHCGATYRKQDVLVIEEDIENWTLAATCPDCGEETLVHAFAEFEDSLPLEAPPDLAEVAAWRHFLARFDGDLRDLMRY
ncbi:MAG: hypothetical protein Kow0077_00120 [Anaerolineae bacterium]